jgi:hypothetical protein
MKIKLRLENKDGVSRLEIKGDVKEIMINEDILHPQEESVALCFRGVQSSGIVELGTEELEDLYDKIKSRLHLIKGFKRLSGGGASLI